jgi:hypothetical protein
MKKRKKAVISKEPLFAWDASSIFNPLRAPMKGQTQPEFHRCCSLNQTLSQLPVALLLSPAATAASSSSLSLSDETAS